MLTVNKPNAMKKSLKIIALVAIASGCATISFAQSSAIAGVSANVITPIAITKVADMNFGNIAVSASTGGSVTLGITGTRTTSGSGVTLPATAGTVAAAAFTVSGEARYTYAITLPSSCTLSDGSGHTMSVSSFASSPSSAGTLSSSGVESLKVSATMSVAAAQAPGTYTNVNGVPVTVNYN